MTRRNGFQQCGAEYRRQDQGHHHRQHHGGNHRDGKLTVNDAGGAGEESHRTEYSGKNQADADQGGSDLFHGFGRGLFGRKAFLAHDAFYIFHNNNGIIHQQSDGQYHGEHREHVDGKTKKAQQCKGAQQDYRHGYGGDQCRPHVAHEQPHDEEYQYNRLDQCFDHFVNGYADERSGVVRINHLHAVREELAHFVHFGAYGICRGQGVCSGGLANGQTANRHTVILRFNIVILTSKLGASDITDTHNGPIGVDAYRDGGEFIRCLQHVLNHNGGIQALPLHRRSASELPGGNFHVVALEGRDHVFNGQAVIR